MRPIFLFSFLAVCATALFALPENAPAKISANHKAGAVVVGPTSTSCDSTIEGALRWSSVDKTHEMCDGDTWRKIIATSVSVDCTPDPFSFTALTNQPLGTLVFSNTLNITGIDPGCVVSVTGAGTPEISVNGGAWLSASIINPGDTLRVRMTTSTAVSTERIAVVAVGSAIENWSVTTKAGGTRIFATSDRFTGDMGGIGGAHQLCQIRAANAGHSGIWRALLSNRDINAVDLFTIDYPVVRTNGTTTVESINLWGGSLQNAISGLDSGAWTATNTSGFRVGSACNNWRSSSSSLSTRVGIVSSSATNWISSADASCNQNYRLYCIEQAQPLGPVLVIGPVSPKKMNIFTSGSPAYSDPVELSVENVGDEPSATLGTSLSNTTNFEFVSDGCDGITLSSGDVCTVSIRAKANIPGETSFSGTFNVSANNNPSRAISGVAAGTQIFVTPEAYTGGGIGGLAAADTQCNYWAGELGYAGTWKALLSDSAENAKGRLAISYPVVRADNGNIVESVDLWNGTIQNQITGSDVRVWTGTNSVGTLSNHCSNWTSTADNGRNARADQTSTSWVQSEARSCWEQYRLYCLSQ